MTVLNHLMAINLNIHMKFNSHSQLNYRNAISTESVQG